MKRTLCLTIGVTTFVAAATAGGAGGGGMSGENADMLAQTRAWHPPNIVLQAEGRRVETIERVLPSVVCVFDENLRGGGSGVLIDSEGYGLTNYHVVAGLLDTRRGWGGLGDGVLYELEVLGIDVTGDVAMFRLIPPKQPYRFPSARLGDSDRVRVGDTAIAMGNPFILSEDYTPTVTLGLVTGVHRYQWGMRGNLTYTDCIQIDAPINPGNSGGPLFNGAGEIIGINGRISVNTRGRFNVGFGYAISINQIKRFIPALRAGLLARHGTWQATVEVVDDVGVAFAQVKQPGPAYDAGVRVGDKILSLDGVAITSANQVISLLGTYPAHWPVVVEVERGGQARTAVTRLETIEPRMRRPFIEDRSINLRQVKRVLRGFQRAVLRDPARGSPGRWGWKLTRNRNAATKPSESYKVSLQDDGSIHMRRFYEDESKAELISYDAETAARTSSEDGGTYPLAPEEKMILVAQYVMHRRLLGPVDELDLTRVAHVGVDALVDHRRSVAATSPLQSARSAARTPPRLLQVIEWPITEQATAKFEFDSDSFLLVRVRVRDDLSGAEATIELSDHQDIGGLVWPCTIEVHGAGFDYRDTLFDWELSW